MTGCCWRFCSRRWLVIAAFIVLAGCTDSGNGSFGGGANRLVQWGAANPQITGTMAQAGGIPLDFDGTGVAGGDGEAILLDGLALVTDPDTGEVSVLRKDTEIAFAGIMSGFDPTIEASFDEPIECGSELNDYLNGVIGDADAERMAAFRLRGVFEDVSYVVDKGVSAGQEQLHLSDLEATMVGVKAGSYVTGGSFTLGDELIGLGEYPIHLHFVTDDLQIVGHVRSCTISSGSVEIALANTFDVRLEFED